MHHAPLVAGIAFKVSLTLLRTIRSRVVSDMASYRKNRTLKVTQRTVFTKAAIGYRSADRPQSSVLSRSDLGVSPGLLLKAELGALAAVAEVHDQAQTEPDGETHPGLPVETGDEHEAEYDGQNRGDRHARRAEAAGRIRLGLAHP